jgi:DNA (cytosine-5)-methyltransferase 1
VSPRILDLFCCAGGAGMGYHRAGFEVVGVDHLAMWEYPFDFHCTDAIGVLEFMVLHAGESGPGYLGDWGRFDAIHASPPCQFGTAYGRRPNHVKESPNLIPQVRELLDAVGLPYVIENNWCNRAHLKNPTMLCGSMFGLDVQRHRGFETNWTVDFPPGCNHSVWTPRFPPATNRKNLRKTVEVGAYRIPIPLAQKAMGIDWITDRHLLSQAIPPAYTEFLGGRLRNHLTLVDETGMWGLEASE